MATQIDKNFVVTTDSIEGYKIVKYLGNVVGIDKDAGFSESKIDQIFNSHQDSMIKKAEAIGANAIVGVRVVFPLSGGYCHSMMFYGTAVLIEPITNS